MLLIGKVIERRLAMETIKRLHFNKERVAHGNKDVLIMRQSKTSKKTLVFETNSLKSTIDNV